MRVSRISAAVRARVRTAVRSRVASLTLAAALGVTAGLTGVSGAAAQDDGSTGAGGTGTTTTDDLLWANPEARSADPDNGVTAKVTGQSTTTATTADVLQVTVEITNSSDQDLSALELRAQRADPVDTPAGVATSLLANQGEYPWVGTFVPVEGTVEAGSTRTVEVSVPVGGSDDGTSAGETSGGDAGDAEGGGVTLPGLGITGAGVHPLLFNFNGDYGESGTAYLAAARTTLTVTGDSDSTDGTPDTGDGTRAGLTVLWPLSSSSVAVAGQVGDAPDPAELYLPDETLAGELSEGGRLRGLLDVWRDAVNGPDGSSVRTATCLAVDPDLLETVERMAGGYKVGSAVPSPVEEPTRLRDSWNRRDAAGDAVDGTGADAAATWLGDLRDAVTDSCVVPLPFANADVNAVAAGGDPWLAEGLTDRGTSTVEEILGVTPATGVQIPGSGYLDADALPLVQSTSTGPVTAVVADSTVTDTGSGGSDGTGGEPGTGDSARRDPDPAEGSAVDTLDTGSGTVRALQFPADLGAALAATGERPETVAYTPASSRRHLSGDGAASRMSAAVSVLDLEIAAVSSGTARSRNILAVPPAAWSVDATDAATFLSAVTRHLTDGSARAVSFGSALSAPAGTATLSATQAGNQTGNQAGNQAAQATTLDGDPAAVNDGEARNVAQIAGHIRNITMMMDDVPNIALTRRVFTRPMFDDLLRSVSDTGRRSEKDSARVRIGASDRTGRVTGLAYALRNAVTLLPPGNVFTRTSDSSPLIVVARNGLPLPVSVRVNYTAAPEVTLNTPGVQRIPARGSVTLQMTSSIPDTGAPSDLTMYLSTPDNVRISEDVEIRVASAPGLGWRTAAAVLGALVLVFFVGRGLRRRRNARTAAAHSLSDPAPGDPRSRSRRSSRRTPRRSSPSTAHVHDDGARD